MKIQPMRNTLQTQKIRAGVLFKYLLSSVLLTCLIPTVLANTPPDIPYVLSAAPYCGSDTSSAYNRHAGLYNQQSSPHQSLFTALKKDGSIASWGDIRQGIAGGPTDAGYVSLVSDRSNFAALKADGSITAWSENGHIATGAPTGSGYISISSHQSGFAALKPDGSIAAWSGSNIDTDAPTDNGYISIASNDGAFAALKNNGSITAWGYAGYGASGEPTDKGYIGIAATLNAFAALNIDGSIKSWGAADYGGSGAPTDSSYISIASNEYAFAALKANGSITAWGDVDYGGSGAPTDNDYVSIASSSRAFAALKSDGSITSWGYGGGNDGGDGAPTDSGYVSIAANQSSFAALKADGSITHWGAYAFDERFSYSSINPPTDNGYIKIASSNSGFAALKADGTVTAWGYSPGARRAPTDSGYIHIVSTGESFIAMKADGSLTAWGNSDNTKDAPTDNGYISINGSHPGLAEDCSISLSNVNQWQNGKTVYVGETLVFSAVADDADNDPLTYSIDTLPSWASFDTVTGTLSGMPSNGDVGSVTVVISVSDGSATTSLVPLNLTIAIKDYDQDGVSDVADAFPYDPAETLDTDGDGLGDNADGDTAPTISMALSTAPYCGSDYNSANNRHGGFNNQAAYPNGDAFAALHANGTISAWGNSDYGGSDTSTPGYPSVPNDSGYTSIRSGSNAFTAYKSGSSATTWGSFNDGGTPVGNGFISTASGYWNFAALNVDGSIWTWENNGASNEGAPTDSKYISIASTDGSSYAALKTDGSITAWNDDGDHHFTPSDSGYIGIASTSYSFAALHSDGSIASWSNATAPNAIASGRALYTNAPSDTNFVSISSNAFNFAALRDDGSIATWGHYDHSFSENHVTPPTNNGYVSIASNNEAFAALKADGSITAWGYIPHGGSNVPRGNGFVSIASSGTGFAALKGDGSIVSWGGSPNNIAPIDSGYVSIASTYWAFAAMKADGSITSWGDNVSGPTDSGYIHISSIDDGFVAMKADGSLTGWGEYAGDTPAGNGYISINGSKPGLDEDCSVSLANANRWKTGKTLYVDEHFTFSALAQDADNDPLTFSINTVPAWASFDPATGTLSGTPTDSDLGTATIIISVTDGTHTASLDPLVITVAVRDYDQDGVSDTTDAFPYDPNETLDTDGDGIGNNADTDDDDDGIPDSIDTDNDNDGMPDAWETQYGLHPFDASDAGQDLDDDGRTNLQEYLNGTNPTESEAALIIPIILELLLD